MDLTDFAALSPRDQEAVNLLICSRVAMVGTAAMAAPAHASGPARDIASLLMQAQAMGDCPAMQAVIATTRQMIATNPEALAVARQFHQALASGDHLSLALESPEFT